MTTDLPLKAIAVQSRIMRRILFMPAFERNIFHSRGGQHSAGSPAARLHPVEALRHE